MANETVVRVTADATGYASALEKAQRSNQAFISSVEAAAARTKAAQDAISEAAANSSNASSRSINAFVQSLSRQADAAGKTRSELLQLQAAQMGVASSAQPFIDKIKAAEDAMIRGGHAAEGLNFSTVGARRELLVLAHEASQGNWSKFGGSMMVLGERIDAMSMIFSRAGLAIGATAAAIGGIVVAIVKGSMEADAFNKSLTLTGNYAGLTADKFTDMASRIAIDTHKGIGTAREALQALTSTGVFSGEAMRVASEDVIAFSRLSGSSIEDVVKDYEKMSDGVAKWAAEHNKQMHYMSAATYDRIKALEEAGDTEKALMVNLSALHQAFADNSAQKLGIIEKMWLGVKNAISGTWDALKAIGRPDTTGDKIARMEATRAQRDPSAWSKADESNLANLREQKRMEDAQAARQAAIDKQQEAAIKASDSLDKLRLEFDKGYKKQREIEKLNRDFAAVAAGNPNSDALKGVNVSGDATSGFKFSGGAYAQALAGINDRYKGKAPKTNDNAVNADLHDLANQQKMIEDATRSSLEHIKALRAEGVISEQEALAQSYTAEQTALQKRIEIDKQQEEIAKGKKNKEAYRKYADDIERLQQQMTNNYAKFGDSIEKMSAKELRNVQAYQESLNKILNTRGDAISGQIAGMSQGSVQRDETKRLEQAQKEYDQKFSDLTKSKTENKLSDSQYDAELAVLQKFYDERVKQELGATEKIKAAEADWTNGAMSSMANYMDAANNVASQTGAIFTNAFKGMEDALTNFVMTGKLNFKSLADSIISEIVRIQMKQAAAGLAGLIGNAIGMFGGSIAGAGSFGGADSAVAGMNTNMSTPLAGDYFGTAGSVTSGTGTTGIFGGVAGARASGGPVAGGSTYLVGEKGPELFTPSQSGGITPNHALGGGSPSSISVQIVNEGSQQSQVKSATPQFDATGLVLKIILTDLQKGGPVRSAIQNLPKP